METVKKFLLVFHICQLLPVFDKYPGIFSFPVRVCRYSPANGKTRRADYVTAAAGRVLPEGGFPTACGKPVSEPELQNGLKLP